MPCLSQGWGALSEEVVVGAAQKVLLMDEISTGLDSATTYTVINYLRNTTHHMYLTTLVSLLQPPPEVYNLFDDVLLLTDGCRSLCCAATATLLPHSLAVSSKFGERCQRKSCLHTCPC